AIEARLQRARKLIGRLDTETKSDRTLTRSDRTARIQQQKRLITNLQSSLQRFRGAESQFREKYRERIKRQYRIVNPMSTERELEAQVDSFLTNPNSQTSIFAQSMLSQSRQQLSAAQSDADAMRRLESSIGELAQAFQDLQVLLASQDEQLTHVEERIDVAVEDIKEGAQEVVQAKEIRKSTRRKMWYLLICIIILIIVGGLVAWNQICGGFRTTSCGK
ncbi:Plasma membrane t-SNARE, secretory vesicle fusion, partial [Gonapodya sp. JEL0774]